MHKRLLSLLKYCHQSLVLVGLLSLATCTTKENTAINPDVNACDDTTLPTQAQTGGNTPTTSAYNSGDGKDIILQGFHWNSWKSNTWQTIASDANAIQEAGFTMVWFPPVSKSTGGTGYLPNEWYNLNSAHGTDAELRTAVNALKTLGVKSLADIVINHRVGTLDWADFTNPAFADNAQAITPEDEWGKGTGNPDTGADFNAGRDLDHTNASVQTEIKQWMAWLKNDVGFTGWRYDFVKGYKGSFTGTYNDASSPYFSVGELWPDITGDYRASGADVNYHRQKIVDWINATGDKSPAFDFTTKWQLMLATESKEYYRLKDAEGKPIGVMGWWPEMAVTFVDNHDTGTSPGGGQDFWPFPEAKLAEGYAYILTHPGTPTVYQTHYFDSGNTLKSTIKTLMGIRKAQGITSTSEVYIHIANRQHYVALVNGNTLLRLGTGWTPCDGAWTLATEGESWAIWTR
ncbi:alpha-amylase [marine bacterium AO1-C]|nr:alpha-amylase [marine bacterium AO1-C]